MLKVLCALLLAALLLGEEPVGRVFLACSRRAYRMAFVALLAMVAAALVLLLSTGCSHQWFAAWDTAPAFDGGWRLLGGQRPHTDFYTHVGAVPLLLTAAGMWVVGPSAHALAVGYGLLFPVLAVWAWALARPRLPALPALLFAALVSFMAVGTRTLGTIGEGFKSTSYQGYYNRLGWSLLCLLLGQVLLAPRDALSRRRAAWEAASAGLLVTLLLFTKMNYFGVGAAALLGGLLLFRETRRAWPVLVGATAAALLAVLAYLRFDVQAWWYDLSLLAGSQSSGARFHALWGVTSMNMFSLALLLAIAALTTQPLLRAEARGVCSGWNRLLLVALAMTGMGLAVCSTNAQDKDIPTFGLAALMLCEGFRRRRLAAEAQREAPGGARLRYVLCSLGALWLTGSIFAADAASIGYSFAWKLFKAGRMPPTARIQTPSLRGLVLPPGPGKEGVGQKQVVDAILAADPDAFIYTSYRYAAWVRDGVDLLRKHVGPAGRVVTLDAYNPFPFALGLPSPRGSALALLAPFNVTAACHLPAARFFREATEVLVPKRGLSVLSSRLLWTLYGPYVEAHYEKIAESRLFILYRRIASRSPAGPTPARGRGASP